MHEAPAPSYRRGLTGFEPVSTTAKRFWSETKLGAIIKLDGKRPRNLGRHNYYWKMLEVATENLEAFETSDQLHTAVKAALGYGHWIEVGGSHPLFIERSISFAKMSESDFAEYLDKAARAITKYWLTGVSVEQLMEEAKHAS